MQINFNTTRLDILPTDESYRYRSIMGEHTLTLYFSLPTYTDIPTGAWCEFQGERYTLNQPAKVVKHNTHHFEYTLTMDSEGANLRNYKFRNPNDKTLKFPFTASPRYHIQILVDCLNSSPSFGGGQGEYWQVGTTIEASEKLISYNHNNCLEALDMIAKAFETEYEIIGKTIHLHKVEYFKNNPLPLQYGKGKGFKTGVSRTTEQSRITRLYVQGGERNIDRSKYGNKELLLPKSQEYIYEGVTFVSDDKGLSIAIKNAQNPSFGGAGGGINEQSLDLSHIYPKRKGRVSAVFEVDKAKHFYDFTDTTIPQALNFSDLQIKGEKMVIYFESGMLSGREFEVQKYDHTQKRFQLVPKEEDGVTMPNDIFKPAIGDQYSVYNMQMPNAYICDNATQSGASWEMMKEACKYLYENRSDLFTFTGDLDGIWAKKHWANVGGRLKMGAYIHFSDTEFQRTPVAIRIVGLKEYVNNPYSPQIELSNKVQGQSFATEIRKLQNQEVYFGELNKRTLSETKRSWRNALETIKQIEEAFPEYTKSIIPATVQTMMALVGNKSGQFAFVANKTNPITVPHTLYFDRNNKQINAGSGWIKHYALGTTDIKPNYSAADYKYWYAPAFVSGRLDDKAKTYYLYIKASKVVETAEFVLSENKIDLEQETGYYHFLYATVNSEYNGERGIAQLNGFTEITGGQIKTDKITSGNGEQYIQLLDKEIIIKANLQITDGNKTEIKQLVNPDLLSLETKLKQYTNDQTRNIQVGGRNLIKGTANFTLKNEPYYLRTNYAGVGEISDELFNGNKVYKFNSNWEGFFVRDELLMQPTIISFWAKTSQKNVHFLSITNGSNVVYPNGNTIPDDNQWRRYTIYGEKGITLFNRNRQGFVEFYEPIVGLTEVLVSSFKIEYGNTPTDWAPAPEDVETQIQTEKQSREQAIATAKTATEAYARTQSELTKAQAIAEANKQAGIAITAEQQARILQLQQNLQQAKTFAEQKVNELQVGGRNLILNTTSGQVIYQPPLTKLFLSSQLEIGEQYTISWKGKLIDNHLDNWVAVQRLNAWEHSPDEVMIRERINSIEEKKYSFTFTAKNSSERPEIGIWIWGKVSIGSLKLERGNKATDWTPAPEDIENKVADIQTDLQNAINNAKALVDAERNNRLLTDKRVKAIEDLAEPENGKETAFSKGIKSLQTKTSPFSDTLIDGNVVATGTMIVGNTMGTQAGISGVGIADNDIRFWAGSNYKDRSKAPFYVLQDGSIYASKGQIGHFIVESADKTSLRANDLQIESGGLIRSRGRADNSRNTIVLINEKGTLNEPVGTRPAVRIDSAGLNPTSHTGLHVSSIGGRYNAGIVVESSGTGDNSYNSVAIDVRSGYILTSEKTAFLMKGKAIFEETYVGTAYSNTISLNIAKSHTYIFVNIAGTIVYLPNRSEIERATGKTNTTFELQILLAHTATQNIRISSQAGGVLLNNSGNPMNDLNFGRGNALILRYYDGYYYIMSHRQ